MKQKNVNGMNVQFLLKINIYKIYEMIEGLLLVFGVSIFVGFATVTGAVCSSHSERRRKRKYTETPPPNIETPEDEEIIVRLNNECAICLENIDFENLENIGILKCNHMFHKKCIIKWFQTSKNYKCPLCLQ